MHALIARLADRLGHRVDAHHQHCASVLAAITERAAVERLGHQLR